MKKRRYEIKDHVAGTYRVEVNGEWLVSAVSMKAAYNVIVMRVMPNDVVVTPTKYFYGSDEYLQWYFTLQGSVS